MPVLKSLKNPVAFGDESSIYRTGTMPIGKIVSHITQVILSDRQQLLIHAYQNEKHQNVLKQEVVKILDGKNYFANITRDDLIQKVYNYMFGYGELQEYVENDDISDIDGTRYDQFSIVKNGQRKRIQIDMGDDDIFETYCKLIATRNGGILNENDSHCRVSDLKNRLRINVSISPRNISGPAISIRKHRNESYSLNDLKDLGMIDEKSHTYIRKLAKERKTFLICGTGGAGKTTLLRAVINHMNEMDRILVVETDAEIYPEKSYCIEQRVKKNNEGGHPITLDELIREGLTMSLDTYCVGEIVSKEAYDFIKASCSGHRMVGTIHANNGSECILRMVSLAMGAQIAEKEKTLYEMIGHGLDTIVYIDGFQVQEIIEVKGFSDKKTKPIIQKIYQKENGYATDH